MLTLKKEICSHWNKELLVIRIYQKGNEKTQNRIKSFYNMPNMFSGKSEWFVWINYKEKPNRKKWSEYMTIYYFIDEKIEISKNIKGYFIGTNVN